MSSSRPHGRAILALPQHVIALALTLASAVPSSQLIAQDARQVLRQPLPALSEPALQTLVGDAFGVSACTLADLALPFSAPDEITLTLPIDGVARQLTLRRHSLRSSSFVVRAQFPDGSWKVVPVEAAATYRALVPESLAEGAASGRTWSFGDGLSDAGPDASDGGMSLASLGPLGLSAELHRPGRPVLTVRPLATVLPGAGRGTHVLFEGGSGPALPPCGGVDGGLPRAASFPGGPRPTAGSGLTGTGLGGVAGLSGPPHI